MNRGFLNSGHIIKEGGDGTTAAANSEHNNGDAGFKEDIYNSEMPVKNKVSNKYFFRFFRLPLIIAVILIAAALSLKFIFFNSRGRVPEKKHLKKNADISDKKRFSSSVFNYAALRGANVDKKRAAKAEPGKFNDKFDKETKRLRDNIKFAGGGRILPIRNSRTHNISKKMVVFIKASYGEKILKKERGDGADNTMQKRVEKLKETSAEYKRTNEDGDAVIMPEGTVLDAYTKYKIFSYDAAVPVIAILSENCFYRGRAVLKKGDKFFGTVSVKHSLNRLNINFNKIIETSGKSVDIDAIAMMPDGSGGVKGDVHRHYAGSILASIAEGVVGAASIFAGGGSGVNSSEPYTFQNQVRENVTQNELNSARNGINGYSGANSGVSITLPEDTPIKLILLKPLYRNQIEKNRNLRK